jgi:hypothetical protein
MSFPTISDEWMDFYWKQCKECGDTFWCDEGAENTEDELCDECENELTRKEKQNDFYK